MSKLTDEQIQAIPGLRAALANDNVTFLNLDTDDTSPTITEGFRDEQILSMDEHALQRQLADINREEQQITQLQLNLQKRRNSVHSIISRRNILLRG